MTLPPLPAKPVTNWGLSYTQPQMVEYGHQCYEAALEEVIARAAQWGDFGKQFISEIESLK